MISVEQQLSPPKKLPIPPLLSHPHPQFVAAKSLMVKPPIFYTLHSMRRGEKCDVGFQKLLRKDASRFRYP